MAQADARERQKATYASDLPDARKREEKAATFVAMKAGYERAKAGEKGLAGYERWFARYATGGPNKASV